MNALKVAMKKSAKVEPKSKAQSKSTVPVIQGDEMVTEAVAKVRNAIDTIKKEQAVLDNYGHIVREFFDEIQEKDGYAGKFRKSYKFSGDNETEVKVVRACKSLKINPNDIPVIQKLLNKKEFKMLLQEKSSVSLKEEIFSDETLANELMTLMGDDPETQAENFAKFFNTTERLQIKPDYDRNIFTLSKNKYNTLSVFVKLQKPGIQ